MSEDFPGQNNAKLLSSVSANSFYTNIIDSEQSRDEINLSYDHMYASNTENNEDDVDTSFERNCQTAESEVKFLKQWLILHLDLIQQQNDEILNKEKTILILQRENEMLKDRIKCMEHGRPFLLNKHFNNHSTSGFLEIHSAKNIDMTPEEGHCTNDNKGNVELLDISCINGESCDLELVKIEPENESSDNDSQIDIQQQQDIEIDILDDFVVNEEDQNSQLKPIEIKQVSEPIDCEIISEVHISKSPVEEHQDFNSYTIIDNSSEFDPMRNLRMSIRRKRVCSNSSALSNNDSTAEEKRFRRFRKKRKRSLKDSQVLMTPDLYITHSAEANFAVDTEPPIEIEPNKTLEVPRWRVKVYASCYAMEGTENLDDEVYNKRHSRLEIDERRRKRWDVQRIREQRVIEKLKQRQERVGSGSRIDEHGEPLHSFWPKMEDIKYLEICDELPVSAFGCPIPKISPSEFSLPWLNNPNMLNKKVPAKRSTAKRKSSRR